MRIKTDCPYFCQWDNRLHPDGSCNMTSLAMALTHYGHSITPDQLLAWCDQNGRDRHQLETIRDLAIMHGLGDRASYGTTFEQIKAHLKTGNLVIVQGNFTPSGHVIVLCGMDESQGKWLCNDPAGHWPHYSNPGWEPGDQVWYDSAWFRPSAAPDGYVWAHLLTPH